MSDVPLIGTIGVVATGGKNPSDIVGRLIRWFTATEKYYSGRRVWLDARVNHAVVFVGNLSGYAKPQLVQMEPGGAEFSDWDSYGDAMIWLDHIYEVDANGQHGKELVPTYLQRQAIAAWSVDAVNKHVKYNFLDYLAIALAQKRFFHGKGWFNYLTHAWWVKRLSNNRREICSQDADNAWKAGGQTIFLDGRPSGLVSPEDLYGASDHVA